MTCYLLSGLGWYPQLEWNQRASGGRCPSPCDSSAVSTALSPPHVEQEFQQEGSDLQVTRRLKKVSPLVGTILFPVFLLSLLGPVQAAYLLVTGFWIPLPFTCRYLGSPTCGSLPTQAQSSPAEGTKEGKNETGLPSSFFLKISALLLLPDPVLSH